MPDTTYSISELAREFAVTPRTIRFYEDQGLLSPAREGQTRVFNRRDRGRLAWILRGKRVGFSLAEIGDMLDLYDLDDGRSTQRRVSLEMCREQLETLHSQKADLDATMVELASFVELLEKLEDGDPLSVLQDSFPSFFDHPLLKEPA